MRVLVISCLLSFLLVQCSHAQQVCIADIALVIDHSGSIRDTNPPNHDNWSDVLRFLREIVAGLDIGKDRTHVAAVGFGNKATTFFNLEQHQSIPELLNAINNIGYKGGNTNTTGALRETRTNIFTPENGDRALVPNILILITDGIPTRERDGLQDEADRVKNAGIRIIGIGVTDQVNEDILIDEVVSKPTDKTYFSVSDFNQLSIILEELILEACRTLAPTPAPTTTSRPAGPCDNEADIYWIMDASGSINQKNFDLVLDFTEAIVQELPIDSNQIRFGLLTFSDNANNQWSLNRYSNRADTITAIKNVQYTRGTTNTASALNYLRNTGFNGNGDRSNIPNIAVIITDGGSNRKVETLEAAFQAKKAGIHVVSVGVGDWTDEYELRTLATYPSSANYFSVPRFNELANFRSKINDLICDNVNECNSGPCRNGGTCVNAIGMYVCLCPPGFAGRNCDQTCRVNSDVVFAMDASGSIGSDNFELETAFVRDLIFGLNINGGTRVGLETFANNPFIRFHLNDFNNKLDILNAMTLSYTRGTTNTAGAIQEMSQNMFTSGRGDDQNRPNVGVVITDGRSNDPAQTWKQARNARQNGISFLAVGIGNNIREKELETIASWPTKSNIILADKFNNLNSIVNEVLVAVCNNVDECSSNPCRNNGACTDLINGYRCVCRQGYSGTNCERGCDGRYDITFIIDASGSIRAERFPYILNFINNVIDEFEVSSDKARFSAVKFSDGAEMQFNFNQYTNKQDVFSAINSTIYMGGKTKTSGALSMMMNDMMRTDRGDRDDVINYAIIITDGGSNIDKSLTVPTAIAARIEGVHSIVIGLGDDLNMLELYGIASQPPAQTVFMAPSYRDLPSLVSRITQAVCDDLNECDASPCRNGGRCVNRLYRYYCDCQGDWTGLNCDRRCTRQMDLVFVLDFSGSMQITYDIVVQFTKEVVNGLPIQLGRTRVGLVYYMDTATVSFYLNDFQSKAEILNAIAFGTTGGRTNTASALRMAYNDVFTSNRGDRGGVPNIVVVVTDGGSNIQRNNVANEANNLRNRGASVHVVAITEFPDMGEVNSIASNPDNSYVVRLPNQGAISQAASQLLDRLCA